MHFFNFIKDEIHEEVFTWTEANQTASLKTYSNQSGYLATVNIPQEHNFILNNIDVNKHFFFGATDIASTGIVFGFTYFNINC